MLIHKGSAAYFEDGERLQLENKVAVSTVTKLRVFEETKAFPVVLMHGMGDAAGNGGMIRIQTVTSCGCVAAAQLKDAYNL